MTQPMLFDMGELAREAVAATTWVGAPLAYTSDYWSPEALDGAWARYIAEYGNFGCIPASHMWHRAPAAPGGVWMAPLVYGVHDLQIFTADTHCETAGHDHSQAPLPPERTRYQGICSPCGWHGLGTENEAVEAWHDHAMPGWRDLPVRPVGLKKAALEAWMNGYPAQGKQPGSPIRTHRDAMATRHVPGRSPWGGYDLAATS